jgi:hypothetical protein
METSNVLDPLFNESDNKIKFLNVEETPLIKRSQGIILAAFSLWILIVGIVVQRRIWTKLTQTSDQFSAIKSLFLSYIAVSMTCYPPILIYFILNIFWMFSSDCSVSYFQWLLFYCDTSSLFKILGSDQLE